IGRRKVVMLAVKHEEHAVTNQVTPSQHTVRLQARPEEKCQQPRNPDRRRQRVDEQRLLEEKFASRQHYIAAFSTDIVNQFQEWPVIVKVPENVGQENQERGQSAQPDPPIQKDPALRGSAKGPQQFQIQTARWNTSLPAPDLRKLRTRANSASHHA